MLNSQHEHMLGASIITKQDSPRKSHTTVTTYLKLSFEDAMIGNIQNPVTGLLIYLRRCMKSGGLRTALT